ncbi:MAG: 16S rRNA (cytosine(1402)-N(4))-methyltransferase RsmH [Candidatus Azotimanducaceae bacterium]|uniref:Ribosomal RNA small subunit methyltransferase H n=1 Tax=OM182 bacterium TaxID=2510334 RepID=A0A520S4V1_9GAMM|nr:16S rRNA (cytosine(1402)-N(4))-methyltransferase [Gammaproteobacteria bacterium]OUV67542.1 MAG: 16S rRNA (cytosine(1402)-N(4))-methyltransferase [Gammaproteobacteria bacterium TMED133]RZO77515.1 MAG: 16S rRNA (cytosine(1402)-N(4))-methyltransferase RsmH [OM182 bacterium]
MLAHNTVLIQEAVDALLIKPKGRYVDCTYGRGGHSQAIADKMDAQGRLLVIDKDPDAILDAKRRFSQDQRVTIVHGSFVQIAKHIQKYNMEKVDGILLDLGVSSPQINSAARGFSFSKDGPLDMRMNSTQGISATDWIQKASEAEIVQVLRTYGEERFARRIARKIIEVRTAQKIDRTKLLVQVIESAVPSREYRKHPATRSFQAIRIHINNELDELKGCLADVVDLLASRGRLVVISFHSLEDRIVKHFIREMEVGSLPARLPIPDDKVDRRLKSIGKATRPSNAEVVGNNRARSAIMRVAEKTV